MNYKNVKIDVSTYEKWGLFSKPLQSMKIKAMDEMSMAMQQEAETSSISVVFRGQKITFPPIDFHGNYAPVEFDPEESYDIYGQFDTNNNKIKINRKILPSAHMSCETVAHETTHKIQDGLCSLKSLYKPGSIEHDYLQILEYSNPRSNETYNRFGIEFSGTLYTRGNRIGLSIIDDVATSFYALSAIERHAFLTADKIMEGLQTQDDRERAMVVDQSQGVIQIAASLKDIQKHYGCENLSVDEMFQVMDRVQTFIAFGRGLESNLDANIAYDMAAILEYQNSDLHRYEKIDHLRRRLNTNQKAQILYEAGFQILGYDKYQCDKYVIFNNMPVNSIEHIDQLAQMSEYEQVNNPIAIINFAFENDVNVIPYLKCQDAFNSWVFSDGYIQQVPEFIRDTLGDILGEKYSSENISRAISETQNGKEEIGAEDITIKPIYNDCGYVFERD